MQGIPSRVATAGPAYPNGETAWHLDLVPGPAAVASQLLQEAALAGKVREVSPGSYLGMGLAGALAQEIAEVVNHWKSKTKRHT